MYSQKRKRRINSVPSKENLQASFGKETNTNQRQKIRVCKKKKKKKKGREKKAQGLKTK